VEEYGQVVVDIVEWSDMAEIDRGRKVDVVEVYVLKVGRGW